MKQVGKSLSEERTKNEIHCFIFFIIYAVFTSSSSTTVLLLCADRTDVLNSFRHFTIFHISFSSSICGFRGFPQNLRLRNRLFRCLRRAQYTHKLIHFVNCLLRSSSARFEMKIHESVRDRRCTDRVTHDDELRLILWFRVKCTGGHASWVHSINFRAISVSFLHTIRKSDFEWVLLEEWKVHAKCALV